MNPFQLADQIRNNVDELPPMPHVATQVMERIASDGANAEDLNKVICQDPSLASRVLQLSNSSFYARGSPVKTLRQAIVNVGFRSVHSLVVAAAIRGLLPNFGRHERMLWEHSIGCGLASRILAQRLQSDDPEQAFLAGLLHDIGKIVFLLKLAEPTRALSDEVIESQTDTFREKEEDLFGFDHAQLGQLLARKWKFGEEIEEAIGTHHFPGAARKAPHLAHVVALGNAYCHKLAIGPTRRPGLVITSHESALHLGLDASLLDEVFGLIQERYSAEKASFAM